MIENTLQILLAVAPVLLLGLIISGLLKSFVSDRLIKKHLSGRGVWPIIKSSLIGIPLPLCSCGVIPVALGLRKKGASKGATASFMVSTPETGADSVLLSFALLGPFMAIIRPVAALISALAAGLLVEFGAKDSETKYEDSAVKSCCCSKQKSDNEENGESQPSFSARLLQGQRYALTTLYDDIVTWLFIGIIAAAAVLTWVPAGYFAEFGDTMLSMVLVMIISIPMYTCATASTPIAAGLIALGISPGAAIIFLLAGPATNVATLGVIYKELGKRALVCYLSAIAICAFGAGLVTNALVAGMNVDVMSHISHHEHYLPVLVSWLTLAVMVVSQKHVRRLWLPLVTRST